MNNTVATLPYTRSFADTTAASAGNIEEIEVKKRKKKLFFVSSIRNGIHESRQKLALDQVPDIKFRKFGETFWIESGTIYIYDEIAGHYTVCHDWIA